MGNTRETFNGHPIYSLSEIAMSLHNVIERTYPQPYFIKAEILKLNYYPHSGHCYPELIEKEGDKVKAEIRGVIWSSQYQQINARFKRITGEPLHENINILCLAKIEYSPKHGLALHIQDIEPSFTLGELMKNRAECIEKLKKEGVFERNRQLQLPLLPKRIAIISVETSKGYSDFITTLAENKDGYRFETTLFPSILQGEKAITGITSQLSAIENRKEDFDCVVIVRGGGGDVGLSCYDDYQMARSVATFPLPVLTGIGHSTNLTVVDMVAHTHKITPTEVAYMLLQSFQDFDETVETCRRRIADIANKRIADQKLEQTRVENRFKQAASALLQKPRNTLMTITQNLSLHVQRFTIEQHNLLQNFAKSISRTSPQHIKQQRESLSELSSKVVLLSGRMVQEAKQRLANTEEKVSLLHPDNILKRGFSITMKDGKAVTNAEALAEGEQLVTKFYKGEAKSVVLSTATEVHK
ncbi:MAG: exodeoxyribonuclease VII large subunit [Bacteroidales bacterium]|nr:exodeoxyribonuclease VII large subunit [Bacteroidales bacterium]